MSNNKYLLKTITDPGIKTLTHSKHHRLWNWFGTKFPAHCPHLHCEVESKVKNQSAEVVK